MGRIAISYRRADSSAICRAIYDRLVQRFGCNSVFIDFEDIPVGENFHEYIGSTLKSADVLVVLVGPNWSGPRDNLPPRIYDVDDPVRVELETAATVGTPILPVLVHRARMPFKADLPEQLQWFPALNAAEVDEGRDFDTHIVAVIEAVERRARGTRKGPLPHSLRTFSNNLPLQLSSFVGRETEISEITTLVNRHRLVTLTGSGGVGKTRTSLQVAANLLEGSGDGAWFIELAPL